MEDTSTLQQLYQETVEAHQGFLKKLHAAFDRRCDEIEKITQKKLDEMADEEDRESIMAEQQEQLQKTLSELKYAINTSNRDALKKMEEIQNKIDGVDMNLEEALRAID